MRMSFIAVPVAVLALVGSLYLALEHLHGRTWTPEKASFVASCVVNEHGISECACTYHAFKEFQATPKMPPAYAELLASWAHAPAEQHKKLVYSVAFWESVRALPIIGKVIYENKNDPKTQEQVWSDISRKIGEQIMQQIGSKLGVPLLPFVAKLKIAGQVAAPAVDFTLAKSIESRHCGGRVHEVVEPIQAAQKKIAEHIATYRGSITDKLEEVVPEKVREQYTIWKDRIEKYYRELPKGQTPKLDDNLLPVRVDAQ